MSLHKLGTQSLCVRKSSTNSHVTFPGILRVAFPLVLVVYRARAQPKSLVLCARFTDRNEQHIHLPLPFPPFIWDGAFLHSHQIFFFIILESSPSLPLFYFPYSVFLFVPFFFIILCFIFHLLVIFFYESVLAFSCVHVFPLTHIFATFSGK